MINKVVAELEIKSSFIVRFKDENQVTGLVAKMEKLFPLPNLPKKLDATLTTKPFAASPALVLQAIKKLKRGTAPGISLWTRELLMGLTFNMSTGG